MGNLLRTAVNSRGVVVREWSPEPGLVFLAAMGAVGSVVWCTLLIWNGSDPAGQVLAGIAAAALTLGAVFGVRARPRLRVDPDGLTIGGLLRSRHYPWPLVHEVRVLRVRRLGREGRLLEVDATTAAGAERLIVLGQLDLAADPEEVADEVRALRPLRGDSPECGSEE